MQMKKIAAVAATGVLSTVILTSPTTAQEMRPVLNASSAQAIVDGCRDYADEKGWNLNIAVLDQGRNLQAFLRMDDAPLGSIEIAQWKANATASFPRATKGTAERARDFPALAAAPNIAIFEGGEAIFSNDGVHLGGVGVSGAAGSEDAECARAGIAAAGLAHSRVEND